MNSQIKRKYPFADATFMMLMSNFISMMRRDAAEFADKGVDAAEIDAFEASVTTFKTLPDDEYYYYRIIEEKDAKNKKREAVQNKIVEITGLAKVKWGKGSAEAGRFGTANMYYEDQKKFLTTARQAHETATDYLAELADYGLTQAKLDALEADIDEYEDYLNSIAELQTLRLTKTAERISLGNNLYEKVVKYSSLGKLIWRNTDRAKYDGYLIYPKKSAGKKKDD